MKIRIIIITAVILLIISVKLYAGNDIYKPPKLEYGISLEEVEKAYNVKFQKSENQFYVDSTILNYAVDCDNPNVYFANKQPTYISVTFKENKLFSTFFYFKVKVSIDDFNKIKKSYIKKYGEPKEAGDFTWGTDTVKSITYEKGANRIGVSCEWKGDKDNTKLYPNGIKKAFFGTLSITYMHNLNYRDPQDDI